VINKYSHLSSLFSYSTVNNTAQSPVDYDETVDGRLQFNVGEGNGATRFISIGINDDGITEDVETFQVRLTALSSDAITINTATVSIFDNDGK
jgi:hypothetical protein